MDQTMIDTGASRLRPQARGHVIGFAHRGAARSRREQNSLSAFQRALDLGATGLESDIGLTADGVPLLRHVGISLPGRSVSRLKYADIKDGVPSLSDLYTQCGHDFDLALDMAEPRAVEGVMHLAREHDAVDNLWLTYWHLSTLEAWRHRWPTVNLVYPAVPVRPGDARRLTDRLSGIGVDVLNVHHRFCTRRLSDFVHAREIQIFAWGIRGPHALKRVLAHGVDGVFCDDVPSMVEHIAGESALSGR